MVLNYPVSPSAEDLSVPLNRRELAAHCASPILAEVGWNADRFDAAVDLVFAGAMRTVDRDGADITAMTGLHLLPILTSHPGRCFKPHPMGGIACNLVVV